MSVIKLEAVNNLKDVELLEISLSEFRTNVQLKVISKVLNNREFSASDFYLAFQNLRKALEDSGYIIKCKGALRNVHPSRMSRQMSRGRKAYFLKIGEEADLGNVVDIFAPTDMQVSTMDEQEKFYDMWLKSIMYS